MDGISGLNGGIGGRIGSDGEIFDRVWKNMGFIENMPLREMYRLLENIEDESCKKQRMTNDPGVVVMAQMVINKVQDMIGEPAERISILKGDSVLILEWIVEGGNGGDGGYTGVETVPQGLAGRRFSICDSEEMSDDETASLMELDRKGCKRSVSMPSSICDSHIDMACSQKAKEFSLGEILDDLEEYHHAIEMNFASLENRLVGLKNQNAYHLQYLKNVGTINDGLFEKIRSMRYEVSELQQELAKLTDVANPNIADPTPIPVQVDLVSTKMSPEDIQIYNQLSKSDAKLSSNISTQNSTPNTATQTTTTHKTTTILIAFLSIIIFMISFFTSK